MPNSFIATVREIESQDIQLIADYWLNCDPEFLMSMGVDLEKVPSRNELTQMLTYQLNCNYHEKTSYAMIWELNGKAVGHCNVNNIRFGEEAKIHLHIWHQENRQKGIGSELFCMSLPYFFNHLKLQKLVCEPFAHNNAPNKTLKKLGFTLSKTYTTIPGSINFEQKVNRWELHQESFIS